MRPFVCVTIAVVTLAPAPLPAQTPSAPHLYLSMFSGYRTGRHLWTLNDQPFLVQTPIGPNPGQYDTLDLQHEVNPGFVIGAAGTYFPRPNLGFEGEIAFLGMGVESRCAIRQVDPPAMGDVDPELCTSLNGASSSLSAVSFSVGLVGRLRPDKATYPYVRAGVGVVARTRSTIELIGTFADTARNALEEVIIVGDSFPNKTRAHLSFAAGLALSLGPASQLRLEARDIVTSLDRVTGLADASRGTLYPPHAGRSLHSFAFIVAFDVILEKRRGRRY